MPEIFLRYAEIILSYAWDIWDMPAICLMYTWDMPEICLRYAWDIPDTCLRYAWDMPEICLRYTWDMPEICLIYAWNMPEICLRYSWDMPEIFLRYAQDMPKICFTNLHRIHGSAFEVEDCEFGPVPRPQSDYQTNRRHKWFFWNWSLVFHQLPSHPIKRELMKSKSKSTLKATFTYLWLPNKVVGRRGLKERRKGVARKGSSDILPRDSLGVWSDIRVIPVAQNRQTEHCQRHSWVLLFEVWFWNPLLNPCCICPL